MMRTVADEGYGRTSVEAVLRRAGISRLTFYQQFADKEDCFLQAYDTAVAQLMAIVLEAYRQPKQWAERVRFGLEALLETLSNEPDLARMAMVEVLAAGPRAIARYTNAVNSFMPLFEAGRTETRYGTQLPSQTERVIVGGIASVITHRVAAGEAERLCELLPDLLYFALTPFLGIAQAARGATRHEQLAPKRSRARTWRSRIPRNKRDELRPRTSRPPSARHVTTMPLSKRSRQHPVADMECRLSTRAC